ncbi:hypothetical protein [Verrucosispora sp. WMMD573]|uniref:hypothetical protein n=1 Tax=Verrucosispora sp. WMMD573 TaxID=3015149 RepID=UPI00248B02AD|nr:hypothetical protein [Verrucosispora sp. WMMD573]WBB56513.1 hypothetical protein O7601_10845 [Verrucosispora sp. WMMD573]
MRYRAILPTAAGILAAVHVLGTVTGVALLRQAEVLALLLLAAYALTGLRAGLDPEMSAGAPDSPALPGKSPMPSAASRMRVSHWGMPVALAALVVDAWIAMPTAGPGHWAFMVAGRPDPTEEVIAALVANWAALVFVVVLALTVRLGSNRPVRLGRPVRVAAVLAGVLVTGYATARLIGAHLELAEARRQRPGLGDDSGEQIVATGVAASLPLALALGAIVLVVLLYEQRRRLATSGAVLLVLVALTRIDVVYGALPVPLDLMSRGSLFTAAADPAPGLAAPRPAALVALELAAYLLLVLGLRARRPQRAGPVS